MRPEWLSKFFKAVGGPNAISLKAWIALAPLAIMAPLPTFSPELRNQQLPLLIAISAIGYLVSGSLYLLARSTYLPASSRRPRPMLALITFFVAGAAIGLTMSYLALMTGLEPQPDFFDRTIGRGWFGVFWSSMVAVLLDSRQRFVEAASALKMSIADTKKLIEDRADIVGSVREELVGLIKDTLKSLIKNPSPKDLNKLADEVIRPLAHFIGSQGTGRNLESVPVIPQIEIRPILKRSLLKPQLSVLQAIMAVSSSVFTLGLILKTWAPANFVLVIAVLIGASKVLDRINSERVIIPISIWIVSLGLVVAIGGFYEIDSQDSVLRVSAINAGSMLLALFLAFQKTLDRAREENLRMLEMQLGQLEWQRSKLKQEIWVESRRLAKFVHGDIQGRIRAAALGSQSLSQVELEQLKTACIDVLERKPGQGTFSEFLNQSIDLWAGALSFTFKVQPDVKAAIDGDSFAREAVIEILRESFVNAVRHGKASEMVVELELSDKSDVRAISIAATNNGLQPRPDFYPGFGSELYSDLSSRWELKPTPEGVLLQAFVSIQTASR